MAHRNDPEEHAMDDPTRMPAAALAPAGEDHDDLLLEAAEIIAPPPVLAAVPDGETPAPAPERDPWRIEDDDAAEWAMSTLAEAEAEIASVLAHAEQVKRKAEEWADRVLNERRYRDGGRVMPSLLESRRILTAHLEWYGRREREEAKRATVDLVAGSVKSRKGQAVVSIEDEDKVLEWAKGNVPALVRVREDVLVSVLRKYVTPTAEGKLRLAPVNDDPEVQRPVLVLDAIPGVVIEPEGLTVTVSPRAVEFGL